MCIYWPFNCVYWPCDRCVNCVYWPFNVYTGPVTGVSIVYTGPTTCVLYTCVQYNGLQQMHARCVIYVNTDLATSML